MANINPPNDTTVTYHDVVTYYASVPNTAAIINNNLYGSFYGITTGGTTYGTAQGGTTQTVVPANPSTLNPIPLTFVDFNGTQHHMEVAGELYALMYQYSEYHRQRIKSIPKYLPEPDFDLDEMAQAAELVESLNGNGTKSP